MRIISFIEDEEVIEKLFKHLGLWDLKVRPPPKVKAPSESFQSKICVIAKPSLNERCLSVGDIQ